MKQTENVCRIEGILSEVDLAEKSFTKDGKTTEAITGTVKIRVQETVNGQSTQLEVPVEVFASKMTKSGTINPAYEAAKKVKDEYISIAASDIDHADRVRITKGTVMMNEYYNQDQRLISFPRISASFITKIKAEDCHDEATFGLTFVMLKDAVAELDKEGVETGRYLITAGVGQYGGKIDVVTLVAANPGVISNVQSYWHMGDTVKASGKLNFSSKTETVEVPVDFGEPQKQTRTIRASELLVTGGNATPLEGDFAVPEAEVKEALNARNARLEELKAKSTQKKAAAPAAPKGGMSGFGF